MYPPIEPIKIKNQKNFGPPTTLPALLPAGAFPPPPPPPPTTVGALLAVAGFDGPAPANPGICPPKSFFAPPPPTTLPALLADAGAGGLAEVGACTEGALAPSGPPTPTEDAAYEEDGLRLSGLD